MCYEIEREKGCVDPTMRSGKGVNAGSDDAVFLASFEGSGIGRAVTPLLRHASTYSGGGGYQGRRLGGGGGFAAHAASLGVDPYASGIPGGNFVAPGPEATTAGMRQNNLGNIGWFRGMHAGMNGLLGPSNAKDVDHSIARYATQEDGIRAAASLALHKYRSGMRNTAALIAAKHNGWTPGALGPGASVNVARAMGLSNLDDLHLDDEGRMVKFLRGLAMQEHGQKAGSWYTEDRIRGALHHAPPMPPKHLDGHPALSLPELKPRPSPGPAGPEPSAHATTARLEEKMERMVKAVERGGLHRIQIEPHRSLVAKKTYQRGSVGTTMA